MNTNYDPAQILKAMFPRTPGQKNGAASGLIPMQSFERLEALIRPMMRDAGYRAMYRGPRLSNNCSGFASMTRRQDATGVLLYKI